MKTIDTHEDLLEFYREHKLRHDWHEPDESGVTAEVFGRKFDNAGGWGLDEALRGTDPKYMELWVLLRVDGQPAAQVNLATLFAIATADNWMELPTE